MIKIEINGKTLTVEQGETIIEIADKQGIYIPRFCYHKKLSVAANCRMCLVDVEKSPKPLPACATPVTAGMKIFTYSQKTKEAQRAVMEFLLINHPLDCPICDQGGECELQDLSLGYGKDISRFTEGKRSIKDDDWGSLISTEMTRCIQCTRCVRFSQEITGMPEIGAIHRGENMQISTCLKKNMISELSGNIIDVCPVGALTSKPFRFKARAWELKQTPSVAPHDCIGSHIYIHTRQQTVMRVVPHENESINEVWISDRDRFSYTAISSKDRLTTPLIKQKGEWKEVDWKTALTMAADALKSIVLEKSPNEIAALVSPSSTIEEFYLLQKLLRNLGCHNIDHRLHQTDCSDQHLAPLYPSIGIWLEEIEQQEMILLLGSHLHREQPLLAHRVRKAAKQGAKIWSINCIDCVYCFDQEKIVVSPREMIFVLERITQALLSKQADASLSLTEKEQHIVQAIKTSKKTLILCGAILQNHPEAAVLRALAKQLTSNTNIHLGYLTEGANSAGAWLAGAIPHRTAAGELISKVGLSVNEALKANLSAYLLFNIEPQLDCANPYHVTEALKQAHFVLAFSPFNSDIYFQQADIILPTTTFSESAGTFVNSEGRWQSFEAAVSPVKSVQVAWKTLYELNRLLSETASHYSSSEQIRDELFALVNKASIYNYRSQEEIFLKSVKTDRYRSESHTGLTRITEWPIYGIDPLVRRSIPLQESAGSDKLLARINTKVASRFYLKSNELVTIKQGESEIMLPVIIDDCIPDGCIWIPAAYEETAQLSESFGTINILSKK